MPIRRDPGCSGRRVGGQGGVAREGVDVMIRRRVLVSGRVQGVWFRETCRREAERAGVAGFVKNRWDGRVEAEFEGHSTVVRRLVDWCRVGPPRAHVQAVEVEEVPVQGQNSFEVYG